MSEARLMRITLNLARTKDFPEGSIEHGYEFVAPIGEDGRIDAKAWSESKGACVARRFWGDNPVKQGLLVHRPGGYKGANWVFDYDNLTNADDEAGYRFGEHVFKPGEYVSIRDSEGEMEAYKISAVRLV